MPLCDFLLAASRRAAERMTNRRLREIRDPSSERRNGLAQGDVAGRRLRAMPSISRGGLYPHVAAESARVPITAGRILVDFLVAKHG